MRKRWLIALAAGLLAGTAAAGSSCSAYASDEIRIIGESEEESAPADQAETLASEGFLSLTSRAYRSASSSIGRVAFLSLKMIRAQ